MKKYKLTKETREVGGCVLHRIMALRDFGNVKKDDLGGWVESEDNLSHDGNCWICDDAIVRNYAEVCGDVIVCGAVEILGDAVIKNMSDYIVFKNWWSNGRYLTWTRSNNMWAVGHFYGTGEELIKKAYADNEEKGREYERIVRYVESSNQK